MRECAITGSSEVGDVVINRIVSYLKDKKFRDTHLEIGTAAAGTLKRIMLAYDDQQRPEFMVVDPMTYFPNQFEIVKNNLQNAGIDPKEIIFYTTKSSIAYKKILRSGKRFDFIFIDGAHKIKQVWQDLRYTNMLNTGAILCVDDYLGVPQVQIPVNMFLKKNPIYKIMSIEDRTLFIEKTSSVKNKVDILAICMIPFINLFFQWRTSYMKRFSKKMGA